MLALISAWARDFMRRNPALRRRKYACPVPCYSPAEVLELRQMLTSTISMAPLIANDLPNDKVEFISATVANSTANPVNFSVTSSNPGVTATVLGGTNVNSLQLQVSGVDANNQAIAGTIIIRLFESLAPNTTAHIKSLATPDPITNKSFYDGLSFHRIIKNFVVQGGDPTGTGSGGSGSGGTVNAFGDEFDASLTYTSNGLVGMANAGHDSNDSQFFMTAINQSLAQLPQNLNFENPIFGIVTSGQALLNSLMSTPVNASNKPLSPATIVKATIIQDTNDGVIMLRSSAGFTGSTTITINADDGHGNTAQQQTKINVVADTANDPPFLGPVSNLTTTQGVPVTFTVQGVDLQKDPLNFILKDPTSFATSGGAAANPANVSIQTKITPASGNTPASATFTLTPSATFTGTINLIVGVRDQRLHNAALSLNSPSNFDTQKFTLTVNPVNHAPTTAGGSAATTVNQPVTLQLTGTSGDPDKVQTLTYVIVSQPAHGGTLTNFNGATGAVTYTPPVGFAGVDSFTYEVIDNGGTVNGGQDTSSVATFFIGVGAPVFTAPVMAASSDDGAFHNDNVILNSTPTFTVTGPAGATVVFLVNGISQVTATETSPGQYSGTLTRQMLQVGVNSITATGTLNSVVSLPTAPLSFTYAPVNATVYTVPGAFGSAQTISFNWDSRNAGFSNELGVFAVSNANGTVNGIAPGAAGYVSAALSSASRQVIFSKGQTSGATNTLHVSGGDLLVFYLIANDTTANFLKNNPQNGSSGTHAYFSLQAANPDQIAHFRSAVDPQTGGVLMSWEDMLHGGDRDFNDAVIALSPGATASALAGSAVRVSGGPATGGSTQNVPVTFDLQPTSKPFGPAPTVAKGEIGVYIVSSANGAINGVSPGTAEYIAAALAASNRQVLFNSGDPLNTQKILQLPAGSLFGFYYVPGGTAAAVLASNPGNYPGVGPVALFSFDTANPDVAEHFRLFDPEGISQSGTTVAGQTTLQIHGTGTLNPTGKDFDDFLIKLTMQQ